MAIEDHPQFPEWSKALGELNAAWDDYTSAKAFSPKKDHSNKEEVLIKAKRRFIEISDKIDNA